jgi:hypothetical protein
LKMAPSSQNEKNVLHTVKQRLFSLIPINYMVYEMSKSKMTGDFGDQRQIIHQLVISREVYISF